MSAPAIAVRASSAEDRPALERLAEVARGELAGRKGGAELLHRLAATGGVEVHLATVDGVTVATMGLRAEGELGELVWCYVDPSCREVGVGRELLEAARRWALGHGCRRLDSTALPGDRDTKNFFETHGMTARLIVVQGPLE